MVLWWCITNKVPDKYKTPWPHPDKLPSSFDKLMHGMFWFTHHGSTAAYRKRAGWPNTRKRLFWVFAMVGSIPVVVFTYLYLGIEILEIEITFR
jgi:hypothetical protein